MPMLGPKDPPFPVLLADDPDHPVLGINVGDLDRGQFGESVAPDSHRPHNEAVLIGAKGRVLAHQSKLHLFNMGVGRMRDCDIRAAPGCGTRTAAGSQLVICDLDGLGRVMTLICKDLQQQVPGGNLALVLPPAGS